MQLPRFYQILALTGLVLSFASTAQAQDARATAQLQAQMVQMEEQIRALKGEIERLSYQQQQQLTQIQSINQQTAAMGSMLAGGGAAAAASDTGASAAVPPGGANPPSATGDVTPLTGAGGAPATDQTDNLAAPRPEEGFRNAREHYNHAFSLLNQAKLPEAQQSFNEFVKAHPEDPLIGNAYYWLGETYYANGNYKEAAAQFKQGFAKRDEGPKAPDNLLKLGMSLSALDKKEEACVVYQQLGERFPRASTAINDKVRQERQRLNCS